MYCPRCSQEQVSEETKFCSRCGLPLAFVADILANGGFLPELAELGKKKKIFTRRNGKILALFWTLFFLLILLPVLDTFKLKEFAGIAVALGVGGGLMILLASIFYLPKAPRSFTLPLSDTGDSNTNNLSGATSNALPPSQSIPVSTFVSPTRVNWRDTKDLIQPSVTENTTKLLSKDER